MSHTWVTVLNSLCPLRCWLTLSPNKRCKPTDLQAVAVVLDVLCHHQLVPNKGHAQHGGACGQGLIAGGVATMAQEALDSRVAQHSRLWHPGHHQHVGGRVALRQVHMALLQQTDVRQTGSDGEGGMGSDESREGGGGRRQAENRRQA